MAGSSMDGLDLAHVNFTRLENEWEYRLGKCTTIQYPADLYQQLKDSVNEKKVVLNKLDKEFGQWIAQSINNFRSGLGHEIDLLSIHGHTVIHKPNEGISWQLGDGSTIAKATRASTVTEFRTNDVQCGGQGAPLVPFGDYNLFSSYDACLNLGGIANISIKESRTAWDICPCNQILNFFSEKLGKQFDENGDIARSGKLDDSFKEKIMNLQYFNLTPPKSLPNNYIKPDLLESVDPINGLYTYCKVIAEQIKRSLSPDGYRLLITGGGAFNTFLVETIVKNLGNCTVQVPDEKLVAFKESLIFAFLGLKRLRNEINTLSSVTGASKDTSSGVIHLP